MQQVLKNNHKLLKLFFLTILFMGFMKVDAQMIETDSVYKTSHFGFSQAVISNNMVYTSGIVGWRKNFKLTGTGSFKDQADQCFDNLEALLKHSNSTMQKVIHLRIYVTDISDQNKVIVNNLIKKHFFSSYKPATTFMCVKALARKELKIEMESISEINN